MEGKMRMVYLNDNFKAIGINFYLGRNETPGFSGLKS